MTCKTYVITYNTQSVYIYVYIHTCIYIYICILGRTEIMGSPWLPNEGEPRGNPLGVGGAAVQRGVVGELTMRADVSLKAHGTY